MMAALATIPHERKPIPRLIALSLVMVAVWWVFLYAFLVIPWQYVHFDPEAYNPAFNALYAIENVTFIGALGLLAYSASRSWRRLYISLLAGSVAYAVNAQAINLFIQQKNYYTGSPYDLLFVVPAAWIASASARYKPDDPGENMVQEAVAPNWMTWLAISGVISVPLLMACNVWSAAPPAVRDFRYLVGVAAIIVLALILFAQQHILGEAQSKSLTAAQDSLAQLAQAREELEYRATHDAMTGCLNRATVLVALERELARARRHKTKLAALLIDLDHFKHINDTLGHLAGDIAIGFVTARMQECLRTHDYVGRYGGEEFLVIIPDCEPHVARDIAERIRSRIASQPATVDAHPLTITATIGMTMSVPTDGPETILRRSDMALYAGKQRGRNTVEFAMSVDSVDYSGAGFSA